MSVIVPNEGLQWLLTRMLKQPNPLTDPFRLRLFQNNYTPVHGSVLADFTQCTAAGYTSKNLAPSGWIDALPSGDAAMSYWAAGILTFTASAGSQNTFGYYVTDPDGNFCLWAERWPVAPQPLAPATPVQVLPSLRMLSLF